ncbi:GNAT family N-acetyltransferase [Peterkaempfera bronchialis]|uniref:GNAT family N-acetyltransferase n=1 Tax=Peterkaempfera bronchialis TaxID=2126346 RepID=UPI003C2E2FE7
MAQPVPEHAPRPTVRPCTAEDHGAVLALVDADRLPGQPVCTAEMLHAALSRTAVLETGWWSEIEPPRTDVLLGAEGQVTGVVCWSVRPRDGAGIVLWLHGREHPGTVRHLVDHALASLGEHRPAHAFASASPLTLGLPALPVTHRPATDRALRDAGFGPAASWRYMRHTRSGSAPAEAYPLAEVISQGEAGWRLKVRSHDGPPAAEATVDAPVDGIGAVRWIGVEAAHRDNGLGSTLLQQALRTLYGNGAREVILYVDDQPVGGVDDRTAANRLYDAAGFTEIDRLLSYVRP